MEVVEYSASHKILHSNSVILFGKDADFELDIKASETFSFKLKIVFEEIENSGINVRTDEESNTITFVMNKKSVDMMGPEKPVEVAKVNGKAIYFQYIIKKLYNGEYKMIDYTLFEG